MPTNPKVSVALITYNQQDYVGKAIESVLNQTYQNFEIIVGDDCSTDETANVIKSYKDERIKYFKTDYNMGMNGNLNLVVSKTNGDIVVLIGGDDKLRQHHLERMVDNFIKMRDVDVLYSHLCAIDKDDNYIKGENECFEPLSNRTNEENIYMSFMDKNILDSPGMAMRRKAIKTIFPLPYSIVNVQDYAMHLDIFANGLQIYVLDEILVDYRIFDDGKNISINNDTAIAREQMEIATLMDYFLKIKDTELLKRVFKDEIQKHNIEPYEDTIPFFLGQMALLSPHYKRKEWGYHTIMKFLRDKKNFDIANKRYGFEFKDYLKLIERVSLNETKSERKYVKKYKKYKKLFKIATIIVFTEVLIVFYLLIN